MKKSILMYHSIGPKTNCEIVGSELYCVSEAKFRAQVEYVKRINRPAVMLSFDDGCIDNYTIAYPILKEFALTAYFFILVSKVGSPGYMGWEEINELKGSGMMIGSHGMSHNILSELGDAELDYELKMSKAILEERIGSAADYLSVPRGQCDKRVVERAKAAGYKAVFTSNIKDSDGFTFGRIPVRAGWNLEYFGRVINSGYGLRDKAKEFVKDASKKVLGVKGYDRLRTTILRSFL